MFINLIDGGSPNFFCLACTKSRTTATEELPNRSFPIRILGLKDETEFGDYNFQTTDFKTFFTTLKHFNLKTLQQSP